MDKEKQEKLNLNLERLFKNIKESEIELVKNYIESFEYYGYNVIHFKNKIEIIKAERYLFKDEREKLIKSFNKNMQLN